MDTTKLTHKQRQVFRLRYTNGWRLTQIAAEVGTTRQSVCELLQRAHLRLGFPRLALGRVWLPKPRSAQRRPLYVSQLPKEALDGL